MTQKKISFLNDEFDLKVLKLIVFKNIPYVFIIFAFLITSSFLYLRYTYPLYKAEGVIQINTEDLVKEVFGTRAQVDLHKKIEVLRSQMFLNRVFEKLPLQVSYFRKGRFLHTEMYKSNPYSVQFRPKNNNLYGVQIFIDFLPNGRFAIKYQNNGSEYREEFSLLDTARLPDANIFITLHNTSLIRKQNFLDREDYFFVVNKPNEIYGKHANELKINILNREAQSIMVSFFDRHPVKAADIVNTVIEEFNMYDIEKQAESTENILQFIDENLDGFSQKLFASKQDIENYKREKRIDIFVQPMQDIFDKIGSIENDIYNLTIEKRKIENVQKLIYEQKELDVYEVYATIAGSELQSLVSSNLLNIQNLLMEREMLLYNVTANNAQIKQIQYRIDIQKKLLSESINIALNNISLKKENAEKILKEYKIAIQPAINDQNLGELSILEKVYNANESFYNQLLDKKAQYTISKAGFVTQNVVLKPAAPPDTHISPNENNIYILGFIASIILSLLLIAAKYLLYNYITSPKDITRYTNIPILGVIPTFPDKIPANQIIVNEFPRSLLAESLRAVRTNMQFIQDTKGSKVIAITSTIPSEGKTFIAMNLAAIIAFSYKKVIVIDLDMRKPKIHLGFKVKNTTGVSTILSGLDEIDNCIHKSEIDNLDFITAGPIPPNPSELIQTDNLLNLINYLKEKYDFVIIDNPPVGIVIDGMRSIQLADYPIYVFKAGYSRKMFIENVERLKIESKIKKISILLNGSDVQQTKYGGKKYTYNNSYGYGYGYGFGYYEEENDINVKPTFLQNIKSFLKSW